MARLGSSAVPGGYSPFILLWVWSASSCVLGLSMLLAVCVDAYRYRLMTPGCSDTMASLFVTGVELLVCVTCGYVSGVLYPSSVFDSHWYCCSAGGGGISSLFLVVSVGESCDGTTVLSRMHYIAYVIYIRYSASVMITVNTK
jgi:hypothetical protein